MSIGLAPARVGVLIDDAIAIYRAGWRTIVPLSLAVVGPFAIAYAITTTFYYRALVEMIVQFASAASTGAEPVFDPALTVVSLVASGVGALFAGATAVLAAALFTGIGPLIEGVRVEPREALRAARPAILPVLAGTLLVGAIQYAAASVTLGLATLPLAVLFAVVLPVIAVEGGVGSALQRSFRLVRPHVWRVAALLVGSYLVATQFEAALATPVIVREIAFGAQQLSALTSKLSWGWKVFDGCVQGVAIALVVPFQHLVVARCYLDLRAREEGMDLLIRARALRSDPQ